MQQAASLMIPVKASVHTFMEFVRDIVDSASAAASALSFRSHYEEHNLHMTETLHLRCTSMPLPSVSDVVECKLLK